MKSKFIPTVTVLTFFLTWTVNSEASYISVLQQANFTYYLSPYYAFIYDYDLYYMESNTGGFLYRDASLYFVGQAPFGRMTTHVAYIYDLSLGIYTEALAFLNSYLY